MSTELLAPSLSWNPFHDLSQVLEFHFMLNALAAGSVVAVLAGPIGWLMVMRRETFAGHSLAMMAFPGAAAAALAGIPAAWGYFAFCGAGALAIARLPSGPKRSRSAESASIGSVQALALGLGFLFVSLYGGVLGDLESLLFGDLLGVSDAQVVVLGLVAVLGLAVLAGLARPLLFASVDPEVAGSRGVPVARLSGAFLLLLGVDGCGYQRDHGAVARVRAAGDAAGHRPGDHQSAPAEPPADGSDRPGRRVAGAGCLLLLGLPAELLDRRGLLRRLPARAARRGSRVTCLVGARGCLGATRSCGGDRLMLGQEFMRNALLAGSFIALACGVCGWFVVMRGQVFAGDALSHVAFPGALAAAAAGIDVRLGLFAATIAAGGAIGLLARGRGAVRCRAAAAAPADDAAIGVAFTFILALGVFFLTRFSLGSQGSAGIEAARTLFGSIFGLGGGEARLAATRRRGPSSSRSSSIARPLLFASVAPEVAAARGVPTRLLDVVLLVLRRGRCGRGRARRWVPCCCWVC